ncbi:MAG: CBS domain-containing protein [Nocardioidaceae bacterium]
MRINEILAGKAGQQVVTIPPDATVRELVTLLGQHNVGALVVSSDGTTVDGIVSERDVVRHLGADESVLNAPVSTIMTAQVHTADPGEALDELMQLMTDHRIRHVPVVVDGALAGIISIGDVVKSRIGELEFERDQIESFVQSQQT